MATWKKVIVSGSSANLATLQVDNLTNNQVVIGGSSSNLSTRPINGTGDILATTGSSGVVMTGSFTGSFTGQFSGTIAGGTTIQSAVSASNVTINQWTTPTTYAVTFVANNNLQYRNTLVDSSSLLYDVVNKIMYTTASQALNSISSSYSQFALTASYAASSAAAKSLIISGGLSGSSYNGATEVTMSVVAGALITVNRAVNVATSSLVANQIPKYSNNTLSGSNISDTGTQVQIAAGATSGLSVAAGGVNVTGNSQFNNNVIVSGDLSVNGTTTFINTQNLYVKDQFLQIASGSTTLVDAGIVTQYNAAGSGSAFFIESTNTGTYGRWATAYDIIGTSTIATADEYVVTAKINQASNPSAAPVWGGASNGSGNVWITNAGDIFIYA